MDTKTYVITDEYKKQRLDVFLEHQSPEFSRSHHKKNIENKQVLVNGKSVKAGYSLKVGDEIVWHVELPKSISIEATNLHLDIVYEDADFAVINKPQGMVVHPAIGNYDNTLVNGLLFEIKDLSGINGVIRPGIVHRLDKNTSGLIVIAKNDKSHISLSNQIQTKVCKRYYYALVEGYMPSYAGEIKTYIARDKKNRLKMSVNNESVGKYAETHYKVIKEYKGYSLVEYELKTGRTHQIRVHSAYLNHAIVGDDLYNNNKNKKFSINGQLLHAFRLELLHPTSKEIMIFEAPLPSYFVKVLDSLIEK